MAMTSDVALGAKSDIVGRAARTKSGAQAPTIQLVAGEDFDRISSEFDGTCQEQLFAYARIRWSSTSIEPVLLMRGDEVVGGTLVMLQPMPLRLGAVAVVKWGPMFRNKARADHDALYLAMVEALVEEYAVKRRLMISIMPRASADPVNREHALLAGRGFATSASLRFPARYIVNLRVDNAAQRKSFGQKWRYHLNKAEKAGLSFEHGGPERLNEFSALYDLMTERKDFADHAAYGTVPAMMATKVDALRPQLFFVRHAGEVVAGAVIYKGGDTAVYLYGATNEQALPLRAGYFLHWHIIRWLRDNTRAQWYDLGGTDGFQGLHQFKKGMVGELGAINAVPPMMIYAAYRVPFAIGQLAFAARELIASAVRWSERFRYSAKPDQAKHAEAAEQS